LDGHLAGNVAAPGHQVPAAGQVPLAGRPVEGRPLLVIDDVDCDAVVLDKEPEGVGEPFGRECRRKKNKGAKPANDVWKVLKIHFFWKFWILNMTLCLKALLEPHGID
jgi:hypothetical protein